MMNVWSKIKKDRIAVSCLAIIFMIIIVGIFANLFAPNDPLQINATLKFDGPSWEYPLGNDQLGRCILSRLIFGVRTSVLFVLVAMFATISIGTILGIIAGYFKGKVDEVIMRVCDIVLSFPSEVMTLAIVGMFGTGLKNILLACILMKWAWFARVFRSAVMKYTDKNYVMFSKASGCKTGHILRKHILPAIFPEIAVMASNNISSQILMVSGLSFLGLGVQAPTPEWGMMLSEAKDAMLIHPYQMLPSGIAIMVMAVSFSFLGDSIRDAMDVKHEGHALKKNRFKRKRLAA